MCYTIRKWDWLSKMVRLVHATLLPAKKIVDLRLFCNMAQHRPIWCWHLNATKALKCDLDSFWESRECFLEPTTWGFPKIVPQNGWFIMENPIKLGDLGVPLFSETSTLTSLNLTAKAPETRPQLKGARHLADQTSSLSVIFKHLVLSFYQAPMREKIIALI